MIESGREKMGDDGSFDDDDDDFAIVEDEFSDEISGYDIEDVVDVGIVDKVVDHGDNDNKIIEVGDGADSLESSSSSSSNIHSSKAAIFAKRRWVLWIVISMVAVFLLGILIGNTHRRSKKRSGTVGHPPATYGNPALAGEPQNLSAEGQQGPLWDPNKMPPGQHVSNSNNGHDNFIGDISNNNNNNNQHQGPPSTEDDQFAHRKRHFTTLVVEWSGAAAVATPRSPSRRALDWIIDEDPFRLTTADRTVDIQQRYIMAVFYFATSGENWASNRRSNRRNQRRGQRVLQQNTHEDLHDSNNVDDIIRTTNEFEADLDAEANFLTYRDVCHWKTKDGKTGVVCDENGSIIKLEFRDFGLGGTVPREVGFLGNMDAINVEYNNIEGTLPTYVGFLTNLQTMKFENNQFTGRIPTELANLAKLQKLDLDGNYFTGTLPTQIAELKSIVKIEIGGSTLRGSIPSELSNLKESLQKIDLRGNEFSGSIPPELGSLTKLNYLDLESNKLTGAIPIELGAVTSLEMLYLNGNDFAGNLDTVFCDTNIAFFEFVADCFGESPEVKCTCCTSCCNTQGSDCTTTIEPLLESPIFLKTAKPTAKPATPPVAPDNTITLDSSELKKVLATISDSSLLDAKHTDQFKAFMWMARMDPSPLDVDTTPHSIILQKYIMTLLYISTNGKEWIDQSSYLTDAGVCDWKGLSCNDEGEIVSIILEHNNLNGTLVSEIGALGPGLQKLHFGMNMLHGTLPSEIGLLSGLKSLDVFDNNDITGTIPSELSIQFLPNLEKIQLVGTGITGNLDPLFCTGDTNGEAVTHLSANCFGPSVICTCCEVCCDTTGENCRSLENSN